MPRYKTFLLPFFIIISSFHNAEICPDYSPKNGRQTIFSNSNISLLGSQNIGIWLNDEIYFGSKSKSLKWKWLRNDEKFGDQGACFSNLGRLVYRKSIWDQSKFTAGIHRLGFTPSFFSRNKSPLIFSENKSSLPFF